MFGFRTSVMIAYASLVVVQLTALPDVVEEPEDSSVAFLWDFLQELVHQSIVTAGGRNLAGAISLHLYRHSVRCPSACSTLATRSGHMAAGFRSSPCFVL